MDARNLTYRPAPVQSGGIAPATPDLKRSNRQYHSIAPRYDANCTRIETLRIEAIDRLQLRPGETVVDVGCGTGLGFLHLIERIGRGGHLIGIEPNSAMMARARRRVECAGWRNVTLIEASAQLAVVPEPADALLFCFTHDVLRTPATLSRLLTRVRPNARIAAAGVRFAPWWLAPLNVWLLLRCRHYLTTFDGMSAPWSHLAALVPGLTVESRRCGTAWVASGQVPTHRFPSPEITR